MRFLMAAAGELTAGDVQLAKASMGHIIAFNLEPSESVLALAKQNGELALALPPDWLLSAV